MAEEILAKSLKGPLYYEILKNNSPSVFKIISKICFTHIIVHYSTLIFVIYLNSWIIFQLWTHKP